jgi:ribosome recycling factor
MKGYVTIQEAYVLVDAGLPTARMEKVDNPTDQDLQNEAYTEEVIETIEVPVAGLTKEKALKEVEKEAKKQAQQGKRAFGSLDTTLEEKMKRDKKNKDKYGKVY